MYSACRHEKAHVLEARFSSHRRVNPVFAAHRELSPGNTRAASLLLLHRVDHFFALLLIRVQSWDYCRRCGTFMDSWNFEFLFQQQFHPFLGGMAWSGIFRAAWEPGLNLMNSSGPKQLSCKRSQENHIGRTWNNLIVSFGFGGRTSGLFLSTEQASALCRLWDVKHGPNMSNPGRDTTRRQDSGTPDKATEQVEPLLFLALRGPPETEPSTGSMQTPWDINPHEKVGQVSSPLTGFWGLTHVEFLPLPKKSRCVLKGKAHQDTCPTPQQSPQFPRASS